MDELLHSIWNYDWISLLMFSAVLEIPNVWFLLKWFIRFYCIRPSREDRFSMLLSIMIVKVGWRPNILLVRITLSDSYKWNSAEPGMNKLTAASNEQYRSVNTCQEVVCHVRANKFPDENDARGMNRTSTTSQGYPMSIPWNIHTGYCTFVWFWPYY